MPGATTTPTFCLPCPSLQIALVFGANGWGTLRRPSSLHAAAVVSSLLLCRCDQATAVHRLCWGDDCHDNRQGLQDTVAGDGWLPPTRGASQSQPCCLSCVRLQVNTLHCSLYCCPGLECFALRVGAHSSPASCQPVHAVLISLPYVRGAIVRADQRATPR